MQEMSDLTTSSKEMPEPAAEASAKPKASRLAAYISSCHRLNLRVALPVMFLVVTILLACRQPYALLHPSLFAEDGNIFFKQQYEMGLTPSLVTPYNGYYQFVPRFIAAAAAFLPLEHVPTAYAFICLLIAAGTFTFFLAAGFR